MPCLNCPWRSESSPTPFPWQLSSCGRSSTPLQDHTLFGFLPGEESAEQLPEYKSERSSHNYIVDEGGHLAVPICLKHPIGLGWKKLAFQLLRPRAKPRSLVNDHCTITIHRTSAPSISNALTHSPIFSVCAFPGAFLVYPSLIPWLSSHQAASSLEYKRRALSLTLVLIAETRSSYLLPVATDKEALTNHFHVCSASIAKLHFIDYYKHHSIAIIHLHI